MVRQVLAIMITTPSDRSGTVLPVPGPGPRAPSQHLLDRAWPSGAASRQARLSGRPGGVRRLPLPARLAQCWPAGL